MGCGAAHIRLSSSALGTVISPDTGEFGIGFRHESLQLLFKQLVSGFGSSGLHRCALGPVLTIAAPILAVTTTVLIVTAPVLAVAALILVFILLLESTFLAGGIIAEIVGPGSILSLRLGFQAFDGKVDLAVFTADNHDFYVLPLRQMLTDIADIGIGHFRNMYHAGFVFGQGNECAEICD